MATKKPEAKKQEPEEKELIVPEYMKKFLERGQQDAASMATASISTPRLTYRGKVFRFVESGEEEIVKERAVRVIVLGVEPDPGRFVKTFYITGYEPGSSAPPDCSSSGGIRPDSWVSSPQSDYCSKCLKNVFGSATSRSGGKAKACKDGKILWVAKVHEPDKYYGLKIPVMSLKNLSEYGKYIHKNGYPLALVVTEIGLDDDAEFPLLTFTHSGFVDEETSQTVIKINIDRPWKTFDVALLDAPAQMERPALPHKAEIKTESKDDLTLEDAIKEW